MIWSMMCSTIIWVRLWGNVQGCYWRQTVMARFQVVGAGHDESWLQYNNWRWWHQLHQTNHNLKMYSTPQTTQKRNNNIDMFAKVGETNVAHHIYFVMRIMFRDVVCCTVTTVLQFQRCLFQWWHYSGFPQYVRDPVVGSSLHWAGYQGWRVGKHISGGWHIMCA